MGMAITSCCDEPEMYRLVCAHLHSAACKFVHAMHSKGFIIHLSASIKQKCPFVTTEGSMDTNLAGLEHTKAPQGPKHGLAEDSQSWPRVEEAKQPGKSLLRLMNEEEILKLSSAVQLAGRERPVAIRRCWEGERETDGVSSQMGSIWCRDKDCRAERSLAFCQWG